MRNFILTMSNMVQTMIEVSGNEYPHHKLCVNSVQLFRKIVHCIAQLVHASWHAAAQTMRKFVVLLGCVPLKWHVVARLSAELCVTILRASVRVAYDM